ncbi:MAG: helix-turn-helix domain-containing protein [Desulfurellales bacterium]|nr:MAG: helix-turn-helix domain-containing protein [Desulfurellales bacterium]
MESAGRASCHGPNSPSSSGTKGPADDLRPSEGVECERGWRVSHEKIRRAFLTQAEHGARLVLLTLADRHQDARNLCCPSVKDLEERTRLGKTAVLEGIKELEESGLVTVIRKRGRNSEYILNLPDLPEKRTGPDSEPVRIPVKSGPDSGQNRYGFRPRNSREHATNVSAGSAEAERREREDRRRAFR